MPISLRHLHLFIMLCRCTSAATSAWWTGTSWNRPHVETCRTYKCKATTHRDTVLRAELPQQQ